MRRTGNVSLRRVFLEMFPDFCFCTLLSVKHIPATVSLYLNTLRCRDSSAVCGEDHGEADVALEHMEVHGGAEIHLQSTTCSPWRNLKIRISS